MTRCISDGLTYDSGFGNYPWGEPEQGDYLLPDGIYHGNIEDVLCCPIYQHGYNTYDWTNIKYFQAKE